MKNVKTFKFGKTAAALLGALALTVGGTSALAAEYEIPNQQKETNTKVTITEPADDPIDPTIPGNDDPINPDQKSLNLEQVPTNYNFETSLLNKEYTIKSELNADNDIVVFNGYSKRKWAVKASVKDKQIMKDATPYTVTSFTINGKEIATGADGVVMQNNATPTPENNTGSIKETITEVGIKFNDPGNDLRVNDVLTGTINYQLYLVTDTP